MIYLPLTLKIRYLNVQHFTQDKETALILHLTENNPDIILINSTSRLNDQPIKIQSYITFSTNKQNERHAGSAIAIKKGLQFTIINNFLMDTIGAKIETSQGPIIVMTSYSPPRHNLLPLQDLEYMVRNRYPTIFAGELNTRHSMFGYTSTANTKGKQLNNLILRNSINYIGPTFNTYFTHNSSTKPDSVLTNSQFFWNYHITSGGFGPSDHLTIDIKISIKPIKVPCTPIQDINNVNWDEYKNQFLEVPEINLNGKTIADIHKEFNTLYTQINTAKDNTTPTKTYQIKNNIKSTAKFKRLSKILQRYSDTLQATGKTEHLSRVIRDTQLMLIQEGNQCKFEWWENQITKIEQAAKNNTKFWRQIRLLSGGKRTGIPNLITQENGINMVAKIDTEKTTTLTNTWSNVCNITPQENLLFCQNNEERVETTLNQNIDKITPKWNINLQDITDPNTQTLPFNTEDVNQAIKRIANKTPGPSKLKKPYISNLPPNIIKNITHLFNCCYATGIYPKQFKLAEIIFIPKPTGPKSDPKNYRPISLLNILGKVFATLLNKKLVTHLENNGIIRESQHGFRKKRSSTTLIANLYERLAREKSGGKNTLITLILRDVRKAFDKVWHKGLIYKLLQTGVETHLLRILANFLHNRQARVKVNQSLGNTFNLQAGVPQGDVLSPTLYLIMCNDYPQPTHNNQSKNFVKQYADDFTQVIISKFNSNINWAKSEIHKGNIEREIQRQNEFEKLWKISTNMDKFQLIHIGFHASPHITINGNIIPNTREAKLLGLEFTYVNFFTKQVRENKKKAKAALAKLYRFRYLNRRLKLRLYKTLVLPLITYPIVPLNAISKSQMEQLQIVQNDAIRWIFNEHYPIICNLPQIHAELRLEYINDRIKRLAEGVWHKIIDEDSQFIRHTLTIPTPIPHNWFPSSYNQTLN